MQRNSEGRMNNKKQKARQKVDFLMKMDEIMQNAPINKALLRKDSSGIKIEIEYDDKSHLDSTTIFDNRRSHVLHKKISDDVCSCGYKGIHLRGLMSHIGYHNRRRK